MNNKVLYLFFCVIIFFYKCGDNMGRNRKRKTEEVDGCLVALVVPVALVCAFPILFIPVIIIIVLIIKTTIQNKYVIYSSISMYAFAMRL